MLLPWQEGLSHSCAPRDCATCKIFRRKKKYREAQEEISPCASQYWGTFFRIRQRNADTTLLWEKGIKLSHKSNQLDTFIRRETRIFAICFIFQRNSIYTIIFSLYEKSFHCLCRWQYELFIKKNRQTGKIARNIWWYFALDTQRFASILFRFSSYEIPTWWRLLGLEARYHSRNTTKIRRRYYCCIYRRWMYFEERSWMANVFPTNGTIRSHLLPISSYCRSMGKTWLCIYKD